MGSRGGADSGTDYGQVDEVTPNDATDYYILDADNDILDVGVENSSVAGIGASDAITLVQVGTRDTNGGGTTSNRNARLKSQASGTVLSGPNNSLNSSTWWTNARTSTNGVAPYPITSYVDPQAGGAWTPALLDAMQVGIRASDATPDIWVSTLWALVEYVPAVGGGSGISKVSGVAQASVKKISGVAEASVKKISGVTNS
jgi:hypothetical protein